MKCIKCGKEVADEAELYRHLRDAHKFSSDDAKKLSGWFEAKSQTPDGELKALDHQVAALKAQKQKEMAGTLTVPMPPPPKQEIKPPSGWSKGIDCSFTFEREISTKHSPFNTVKTIVKGKVTRNHGELISWRFDKNISELLELQEKEQTLSGRLTSLIIDDPAYVDVASVLHQTRKRIKELNKNLKAEESTELVLEDYWYNDFGTPEHEKFQLDFMNRCLIECERLTKNSKNESDEK